MDPTETHLGSAVVLGLASASLGLAWVLGLIWVVLVKDLIEDLIRSLFRTL